MLDPKKSFVEEAMQLEEILSLENKEGLSKAQVDFLRFRLGIVYALVSETSQANDHPSGFSRKPMDTSRTIYSNFAKNFLRYYTGDENLYLACEKSRKIFDDTDYLLAGSEQILFWELLLTLGHFWARVVRCFSSDVFKLLINKMLFSIEIYLMNYIKVV